MKHTHFLVTPITVIIPLYNKAEQVEDTLYSLCNQSFDDYRVIIIDDGSTDGSADVVHEFLSRNKTFASQVSFIRQSNQGVSAARNKGIQLCQTEWIAFLDADDLWKRDYLQIQYDLSVKYPCCNVCATAYEMQLSATGIHPIRLNHLSFTTNDCIMDNYFEVAACSHPPLSSISTMIRKSALIQIGGFPTGIRSGEDILTWAKLALTNKIAFSKRLAATFVKEKRYFNDDQQSRRPAAKDTVGETLQAIYRQNPQVPGLKRYVGIWYKMRTHIYLDHGMKRHAFREWKKAIFFHPFKLKTWAFLLFILSPLKIAR